MPSRRDGEKFRESFNDTEDGRLPEFHMKEYSKACSSEHLADLVYFVSMRIIIQATNIEHTNAIDSYVAKRLKELERMLKPKEESSLVRVEVGKSDKHHKGGNFFAEVMLHAGGKDFRVVKRGADLYAAIDEIATEIVREVTRFHGKTRVLQKKGAREAKRRMKGI